jgi:Na+/phosphate symporter
MTKVIILFKVLDVRMAIPMVMGANIGTSLTSTLVSLTQVAILFNHNTISILFKRHHFIHFERELDYREHILHQELILAALKKHQLTVYDNISVNR